MSVALILVKACSVLVAVAAVAVSKCCRPMTDDYTNLSLSMVNFDCSRKNTVVACNR